MKSAAKAMISSNQMTRVRTSGSSNDSRLPEFVKTGKTGNRMRLVGHGNLLFVKSDRYSSILTGASRNERRVRKT